MTESRPSVSLHSERPASISELTIPSAVTVKRLLDDFEVTDIDLELVKTKAANCGGERNGIQELYYTGLYSWISLRERLEDVDLREVFDGTALTALEQYAFRTRPETSIDGQLQSSFSSPTILSAWVAAADKANFPKVSRWDAYHGVDRADVVCDLRSEWFPRLLRDASKTNSGLYRNSTGFKMSYRRFVARSINGALRRYHEAVPGGEFPIEVAVDAELQGRTGRLSDDFSEFLKQRLRKHNRGVHSLGPEEPLHEGASRGCPFSRSTHYVEDASLLADDIGYRDTATSRPDKARVVITWDPYKHVSALLAQALEAMD